MLALLLNLLASVRSAFRTRADLALENLALRQQLTALHRRTPWVRLRLADRAFWVGLSQIWSRWSDALVIVKPDTVVRWHRAGFRLLWKWKSRSRTPSKGDVSAEVRQLIRRMAESNVTWGTSWSCPKSEASTTGTSAALPELSPVTSPCSARTARSVHTPIPAVVSLRAAAPLWPRGTRNTPPAAEQTVLGIPGQGLGEGHVRMRIPGTGRRSSASGLNMHVEGESHSSHDPPRACVGHASVRRSPRRQNPFLPLEFCSLPSRTTSWRRTTGYWDY